ncbi:MAG: PEP-CTERM sorting domain-containing protein, partial [Bryobacteraceae bacterium]
AVPEPATFWLAGAGTILSLATGLLRRGSRSVGQPITPDDRYTSIAD